MAMIESLVNSFVKMSAKEQFDFIMAIRQRRRTRPENPRKFKRNAKGKRDPKKTVTGKKLTPEALLHALSQEDKDKLLRELGVY